MSELDRRIGDLEHTAEDELPRAERSHTELWAAIREVNRAVLDPSTGLIVQVTGLREDYRRLRRDIIAIISILTVVLQLLAPYIHEAVQRL